MANMLHSNTHFYKYPQSYQYVTTYELYLYEPIFKPRDRPSSFLGWRKLMDSLSPWRVSSLIKDPETNKRKLKFLFDGYGDMNRFLSKVKVEYPALIYEIKDFKLNT